MIFPDAIERWRSLALAQLQRILEIQPSRKSLINALGLTISPGVVDLILAIVQKESWGNPDAVGDNGNSIGLMQLNYGAGTPQGEGFSGSPGDLADPATNLYYGIKYFLHQLAIYQDVDRAILAYNAGSYRVTQAGSPINQSYLDAVLSYLSEKKTSFSRLGSSRLSGSGSTIVGTKPAAAPPAAAPPAAAPPAAAPPAAAEKPRALETLGLAAIFALLISVMLFLSNC